jgi:hypothetical protein
LRDGAGAACRCGAGMLRGAGATDRDGAGLDIDRGGAL